MTETPPETPPPPHAWLPVEDTLTWLQLEPESPLARVAEWCRQASADYCWRQRRDAFTRTGELVGVELPGTIVTTADVVMAGMIGAARLYARRSTPAGLASFGEFGASEVMRLDPDVARLLGVGRHAEPACG